MKLSSTAEDILNQINTKTRLGDLRSIAKSIKKDHELALELWSTGSFLPRQLAILIVDGKALSQEMINKLDDDMQTHPFDEQNQLIDWLMVNQLLKDKRPQRWLSPGKTAPPAFKGGYSRIIRGV